MKLGIKQQGVRIAVLLVLVAISWWLYDRSRLPPPVPLTMADKEADAFLSDFRITAMSADGAPQHQLQAERMTHYPHNNTSEIEQPYMTLYRDNEPPWYVQSERGLIKSDEDKVFLLGAVRMDHEDNRGRQMEVHTHDVEVHPDAQYAETAAPVTIIHDLGVTTGIGMRAFLQQGRLSLLAEVKGTYEPTRR